jgi:hypothetical protein
MYASSARHAVRRTRGLQRVRKYCKGPCLIGALSRLSSLEKRQAPMSQVQLHLVVYGRITDAEFPVTQGSRAGLVWGMLGAFRGRLIPHITVRFRIPRDHFESSGHYST